MMIERVLVSLLVLAYVLLPLDRGFPTIPIFGRPLNAAIAMSLVVFAVFAIRSRGQILRYFLDPYAVFQLAYSIVFVVSALRAPSALVALHWSALYIATFLVNYIVLRHVLSGSSSDWFTTVAVLAALGAASVGIAQSFGVQLSAYDIWSENYFRRPTENFALSTVRAAGTMGNPITFCMLLLLAVPYALNIRTVPVRAAALFVLLFAVGLSGSRTALPILAVLAGGALAVWRWRAVRAWPAITGGLVMLIWAVGWLVPAGQTSRASFLVERTLVAPTPAAPPNIEGRVPVTPPGAVATSLTTPGPVAPTPVAPPPVAPAKSQAAQAGQLGVSLRIGALLETFREMSREWTLGTWLAGRGAYTAPLVGQRLQPWYNTIDNVFITVLYERGLIGLVFFVAAFGSVIYGTRRAATRSIHWYAPLMMAVAGLSFCWDAFSTFNILAVGSMALVVAQTDDRSPTVTRMTPAPAVKS